MLNAHHNTLERRRFALRVKGAADEDVAFWVVHCGVAGFDVGEGRGADVGHRAGGAVDGDEVAILEPQAAEVVGVEHDHVTLVDAAVDVFVFVNDRVELAFAADCHQAELAFAGAGKIGQVVRVQAGAAIGRGEPWRVERAAADLELLLRSVDVGHFFEARNDAGDRLADLRGGAHLRPIEGGQPPALPGVCTAVGVRFLRRVDRRTPGGAGGCRTCEAFGDGGDDVDLAAGAFVAAGSAIAEADVVEH